MESNDVNKLTIQAYNNQANTYIESTPEQYNGSRQSLRDWIDEILAYVRPQGSVLEIGSATPRDARYIRSKGFEVQCSDATPNFVAHLKDMGETPLLLDVTNDPIPHDSYDLIFANAVFPHLNYEAAQRALTNISQGLKSEGILAFNVKQGDGDEWINEKFNDKRFIHYWQPHEIYEAVSKCGFDVITIDDGIEGERPTHIWTRIIAQKI
jgi:SAM-dependent methyltransferase